MVSSELPEIVEVADRVLAMRRCEAVGMLGRGELSETTIMRHAVGVDLEVEASHV